ncbi:hypothetical protein H0H81_001851 [Sphagnurus paluster]|uniref:Alpha/beta hydrolase fold-3 domain-containing protein n=1 Tax=Sphagnurus paluster TaxID=117069 RepID=A0A9P7K6G0_9AGAR|nr:hypothetical protein H0H81_001851 [Sphagnurus paluster]
MIPNKPLREKYGEVSWIDLARILVVLAQLPTVLLWNLFKAAYVLTHKSWRRILGDTAFRFIAGRWNARQFQYVFGTTLQTYQKWTKQHGIAPLVEEIDDDARLMWIGPRRMDRVVLYFHGGGYVIPMQDFSVSFWNFVRLELAHRNVHAGFAVLNYSIVPTAIFPTQLTQAVNALKYVLASGCRPENIQIVGDSAGANLAISLLAHILHPVKGVPELSSPRIKGMYLMSPWVSLTGDTGSHSANDNTDIVGAGTFGYCGRRVLESVPESLCVYLEASKVPMQWFHGIEDLVERVLFTAGEAECLRDDIIKVSDAFSAHHSSVELIVDEDGVHNDPFYDFLVGEKKNRSKLTAEIISWLQKGFEEEQAVR